MSSTSSGCLLTCTASAADDFVLAALHRLRNLHRPLLLQVNQLVTGTDIALGCRHVGTMHVMV
jgi:hypothetical protein